MLHRKTILALGLGSLLSLAAMAPAVADRDRGNRHESGSRPHAGALYAGRHQQRSHSGRNHRPALHQHRHSYRRDHGYRGEHRYRGNHGYYPKHRRGHDHRFANGLIFGGILGYIIGNDY